MHIDGSIVALITPFDKRGRVDYLQLRNLVRRHVNCDTNGIVVLGTTGENPTLSPNERTKILEVCCSEAKGKIPIIAGAGTNNTAESIIQAKTVKEIGADAALVIVPYYNKPPEEGCIEHFRAISGVEIPLIIYHHPGRTGVSLSKNAFKEILNMNEVIAVKECSGNLNFFKQLTTLSNKPILCGDDELLIELLSLGAKGTISVLANVFPNLWAENFSQKPSVLNANLLKLGPLMKVIYSTTNPIGIKYAMSCLSMCTFSVRLPLIPPKAQVREKIQKELKLLMEDQDLFQVEDRSLVFN